MSARLVIVTLATAWGPRYGGINAFNTEMVKSLGILPERDYDLICVVRDKEPPEQVTQCKQRFGVELLCIENAAEVVRRLDAETEPERFVWVGHDDKTGPLALELRQLTPGRRAVLINHMAPGAYQSVKKGGSAAAAEKEQAQRELFRRADLCYAVGPMLRSHLQDLLGTLPERPPVEMLVPGLVEPTEYGVEVRDTPPENYVAIVAGRLDWEDDRIKQGRLALRAFADAVLRASDHSAIRRSPKLRMRGVRPGEEEPLLRLLTSEAKGAVSFDFQDYTEDRTAYFRDLTSASVAMMPSWHEGFGLTAWEAIASAVPIIISDQSGVYRLLDEECSGAGIGRSVARVVISGSLPMSDEEPNHTEDDVVRVRKALLDFAARPTAAKQQALTLRSNLLRLGYDWRGCAVTFIRGAEKHLGLRLAAERAAAAAPHVTPASPADLTIPQPLRIPAPRPWNPNRGLPTSMLLTARDEIVRFDPEREPLVQQMLVWASTPMTLSARLLFARGGMGKTRLALEFARRLQESGWLSLWLPAVPPAEWASVLGDRGDKPALIVIDYADARPAAVLDTLNAALESLRSGSPSNVRVLLLARSESWLGGLAQHPGCSQDVSAWLSAPAAVEPVELPSWSSDEAIRLASYEVALEDYAAAIGVARPFHAHVPSLGNGLFGRPLYLHLAALAALEGQRPESAGALLHSQLQREWRYWCGLHGEKVAGYEDWADALAYIILQQGVSSTELQRALESLQIEASGLVPALQRSYPTDHDRVAPLEPDLIAEALLRERLAGQRGAAILDLALGEDPEQPPSAIQVLARLAAHPRAFEAEHAPSAWAAVLIQAIARHWPRYPNEWLTAAHRGEYGLGPMLGRAWKQLDETARVSVAKTLRLPGYSTNLLDMTVAVRRQQLKDASDPASKAGALNDLAVALADLGDADARGEALARSRESTAIYRELAATDPPCQADLAMSLNNLANRLSQQADAKSRDEAVVVAREAVKIHQHLVETEGAAFLADLAMSLTTLGNRLSEQGGVLSSREALAFTRHAVAIDRKLAAHDPAAYQAGLASSLYNLSDRLSKEGDADSRKEAVDYAREAVEIRKQLAETQPAAYLPELAAALTNLALRLSELNDPDLRSLGRETAREAVRIYRDLAALQPIAHRFQLAWSLNNMVKVFGANDAASRAELLGYVREAVEIFRELVGTQRAAHLPHLASSLTNLAVLFSKEEDATSRATAGRPALEVVEMYRELTTLHRHAYLPELGQALHNLAIHSSVGPDIGVPLTPLDYAREAVQIRRELASDRPNAYEPALAASLESLARRLSSRADPQSHAEALDCAREATQIFARLRTDTPTTYETNFRIAVATLKRIAVQNGRNPEEEVRDALGQ